MRNPRLVVATATFVLATVGVLFVDLDHGKEQLGGPNAVALTSEAPTTTVSPPPTIQWTELLSGYSWGERSSRVGELQQILGIGPVDNVYGYQTYEAHSDLVEYMGVGTLPSKPIPAATKTSYATTSADESIWDRLAQCEAGGVWSRNSGNGFGGGLQFMHQSSYSTWLSFGGGEFAAHPWEATREQQIVVAERVLASSGWNAWPGCSRKLGLL